MFLGQIAAILAANGAQLNFSALAYVQSDTGLIRLERPRCIMGRNYLIMLTQLQMEVLEAATLATQRSTNASVIALANAVIARVQQEVAQYTVLINGSSCQ